MGKLIIQHLADHSDSLFVARIGIPAHKEIQKVREGTGRVMLVSYSLESFAIITAVEKIDLKARIPLSRNLVLNEIPGQPHELVVAQVLLRLVPCQQPTLRVQHSFVPGQLCVHILLCSKTDLDY